MLGFKPVLPGFEIKQTSTQRDAEGNVEKEWIQQRPESGPAFQMPPGQTLKGVSVLTDQDGRARLTWHKTKSDDTTPDLVASLERVFKAYKRPARLIARPRQVERDLLSVYPVADLHLGMLAWGKETGEDYDTAIAGKRLRDCLARLVAQAPPSRVAILLNLGDWQHTNDQRNATPRSGHVLDVDSRFERLLDIGQQLQIDCVDMALQRHDTVIVVEIPGNHDPQVAVALRIALRNWYRRDKRVVVHDAPGEFFFHRFGSTLIGAHHGHGAKPAELAMKMATDRRRDWGETLFHYFYTGHLHHERARQVGDCRVETFETIAAKDAHATGMGYTSGQALTSITIDRRAGEIGRHRVNIPPRVA